MKQSVLSSQAEAWLSEVGYIGMSEKYRSNSQDRPSRSIYDYLVVFKHRSFRRRKIRRNNYAVVRKSAFLSFAQFLSEL